jgi:hypothetical protein
VVFADHGAQASSASHGSIPRDDDGRVVVGRKLPTAVVSPVIIEVIRIRARSRAGRVVRGRSAAPVVHSSRGLRPVPSDKRSGIAACQYSLINQPRIFLRRTRAVANATTAAVVSGALGGR